MVKKTILIKKLSRATRGIVNCVSEVNVGHGDIRIYSIQLYNDHSEGFAMVWGNAIFSDDLSMEF